MPDPKEGRVTGDETLARIQRALVPFDVYIKETHLRVAADFDPKRSEPVIGFQIRHDVQPNAAVLDIGESQDAGEDG